MERIKPGNDIPYTSIDNNHAKLSENLTATRAIPTIRLSHVRSRTHRKYMRCLFLCFGLLSFLLLLYIPAYHQAQSRIGEKNDSCIGNAACNSSALVGIPGWDYNTSREIRTYVFPDNSTALHEPQDLCSSPEGSQKPLLLVVVICSAVENFEQRDAIRKSWASEFHATNKSSIARVSFLLGLPENDTLQSKIDEEVTINNDVIQESFIDSYNNLTLKSVMMLKWINTQCVSKIKFVMKTDDDVYVNVPALIKLLKARIDPQGMLIGCLICGARPIADTKSKWYSPKYMYSGRVYPNYLSGTGYVMSSDVITKLYKVALRTPLFHLEDVYITGMCARQAQVIPRNNPGFSYQTRKFDPCVYKDIVTAHRVSPDNIFKMYSLLKQQTVLENCKLQEAMATQVPLHSSPDSVPEKVRSRLKSQKHRLGVGRKAKNNCF